MPPVTLSPVSRLPRPSTWFVWHGHRLRSGMRVLDLACGEGRHSLAAAALGTRVTALDRDEERLATARELAQERGLEVDWRVADLEGPFREVYELRLISNCSYDEIADKLTIPRSTVGTRLLRARQKLKSRLLDLAAA